MPDIIDEVKVTRQVDVQGLRDARLAIQKVRPVPEDGDKFPSELKGEPINVISFYHQQPNIDSFHLNAKQTFEYLKKLGRKTIDIYGPTDLFEVKFSLLRPVEFHILRHKEGRMSSIARIDLHDLKDSINSTFAKHPEFFT